jgi:hypothetical protein
LEKVHFSEAVLKAIDQNFPPHKFDEAGSHLEVGQIATSSGGGRGTGMHVQTLRLSKDWMNSGWCMPRGCIGGLDFQPELIFLLDILQKSW